MLSLFSPGESDWEHIRTVLLPEYVKNTFLLMVQVAALSLAIGVSTAWLTAATTFPGKRLWVWALSLPLAMPTYIMAYVYTDLLDFSGPVQTAIRSALGLDSAASLGFPAIRSLPGAACIMGLSLYPYVYLLARVAFVQRSTRLFDAARTLGASPWRAFFRIALPASRAAIVGGLALVLMETLADFGVVEYFGVPTFSTGIFRTWFAGGDKRAAMKLAAVMFVFVVALVALEKWSRRRIETAELEVDSGFRAIPLSGWRAWSANLACGVPVVLGCIVPVAVLIKHAVSKGDPLWGSEFVEFATNSVKVALLAALAAVVVALVLTYAQRRLPLWILNASVLVATLGYALPGTMLAVGILPPLSALDRSLAGFFDTQFGWRSGLILTGSIFILIYAYLTRFLTVAFNTTHSAVSRIPRAYEQAASTLGAGPLAVVRRIQIPLTRRAIVTAVFLVFVDTMRELPATLILRPFNFETLATRVYRLASDERLAEASSAALTIVVIGLVPVLLLNVSSERGRARRPRE